MNLPRALALTALGVLIIGSHLAITGFDESARRISEQQSGLRSISADSEFVRALLATPVMDDLADVSRTVEILRIAGREADAQALQRFFESCNVERMLGTDDACRSATVDAAIAAGRTAPRQPADPAPAPSGLEAQLAAAWTFGMPDESRLRSATDPNTLRLVHYDSPGVLRYETPANGAYLFIVARNRSPWRVTTVDARLALQRADRSALELECSSARTYPFYGPAAAPGGDTLAACKRPDNMSVDELLAAVRAIVDPSAPSARPTRFYTENPYTEVVDRGTAVSPRFTIAPIRSIFFKGIDRNARRSEKPTPLELLAIDCHRLATCPTAYQSFAMTFVHPLEAHLIALPVIVGILLGVIVGGLFRRAFTIGGVFAGLAVMIATVGIAYLFRSASAGSGEHGFALLAVGSLAVGSLFAFLLGLPAFFLMVALMRTLHGRNAPVHAED
jgi:hypothetical protein